MQTNSERKEAGMQSSKSQGEELKLHGGRQPQFGQILQLLGNWISLPISEPVCGRLKTTRAGHPLDSPGSGGGGWSVFGWNVS